MWHSDFLIARSWIVVKALLISLLTISPPLFLRILSWQERYLSLIFFIVHAIFLLHICKGKYCMWREMPQGYILQMFCLSWNVFWSKGFFSWVVLIFTCLSGAFATCRSGCIDFVYIFGRPSDCKYSINVVILYYGIYYQTMALTLYKDLGRGGGKQSPSFVF